MPSRFGSFFFPGFGLVFSAKITTVFRPYAFRRRIVSGLAGPSARPLSSPCGSSAGFPVIEVAGPNKSSLVIRTCRHAKPKRPCVTRASATKQHKRQDKNQNSKRKCFASRGCPFFFLHDPPPLKMMSGRNAEDRFFDRDLLARPDARQMPFDTFRRHAELLQNPRGSIHGSPPTPPSQRCPPYFVKLRHLALIPGPDSE